MHYDIIITN